MRKIFVLWWMDQPIGICVFTAPAASLTLRSRAFGLQNPRSLVALQSLNQQVWLLARVVLHPTWRGAGVATAFVRTACKLCPVPWIETLTAMGRVNPFFERAGFRKIGVIQHGNSNMHGAYGKPVSAESQHKSRYSEPVYYVFDNRS